jgi:hypothetical protein
MPPARPCWVIAALGMAALLCTRSPLAIAQLLPPAQGKFENLIHPPPAPVPVEQIVRFALVENDLAISSSLKLADGRQQVQLEGIEGYTRAEIGRRMRRSGSLLPFFDMVHTGAGADGSGTTQTTIYAQGSVVRIERTVQLGDRQTTLRLRQDGPSRTARPAEPRGDRVTLQIRSTRGEAALEDLRVSAESFAELLRKFPGPAARHLLPMFHQFQQDAAVFRIEPEIAWQLFPDAIEADEASASKVLELVDRLDAPKFDDRELATIELEVMGGPAVAALAETERLSLSAEQNTRIDAILNRYRRLSEDQVRELLNEPEFLLRCFTYSDLQPIRAAAAATLIKRLGESVDWKKSGLDSGAPLPRRFRLAEMIRSKLPADE